MKLRIRANTIRFRLSQGEVSRLAAGEPVEEVTPFSIYNSLRYSLETWNLDVTEAKFENGKISVFCPASIVSAWAVSDEEGFQASQATGTGATLEILVEKDFACLKPRTGEDESDHFPHPKSGELKC